MAGKKSLFNDIDGTAPDELGHFKHHFSITMELDKHPLMMAMAAIAVGLVIIYVFNHIFKSGSNIPVPATGATPSSNTTYTVSGSDPLPVSIVSPIPIPITGGTGTGSGTTTYTITAADMKIKGGVLHHIAARFGISYDALYNANVSVLGSNKNHAKFSTGTILTIPSH